MKKIIYEISICLLAIVSVAFAILDMMKGLSTWMALADNIIYFIFLFDYIIRFLFAKSKKLFFKDNIFDLIAIIPVNSALRIFRTVKIIRLAKLAKIAKLTKVIAVLGRFTFRCKSFLNTNGFKYMLMTASVLIVIGGTLISYFEGMTFPDGIWWSFVTTTTVGYGDISPSTGPGRIVACVLMLVGIGLIGSLTSTITSFFMNEKSKGPVSSDKVSIALIVYNELNDSEKENFKKLIEM